MAELAVASSRKIRLQQRAEAGDAGAEAALKLANDPGRFLSTVQIGITLVGVLSGAFSGAAVFSGENIRFFTTTGASALAGGSSIARGLPLPRVTPAMSTMSLTATGRPSSGPSAARAAAVPETQCRACCPAAKAPRRRRGKRVLSPGG